MRVETIWRHAKQHPQRSGVVLKRMVLDGALASNEGDKWLQKPLF
jgi:hypothetical protein